MVRAAFTTLGCKVNQYETQRILSGFEGEGFKIVPFDAVADVYVVNTCSVTSIAEAKSRYTIRKALRTNPSAILVATGCAAQMSLNRSEPLDGVHVVVPNPEKLDTIRYLYQSFPEFERQVKAEPAPKSDPWATGRTRATLKVQDGCNVYCSYCSIPFTRPGMRSVPAQELLREARALIDLGFKEIVLTGVLIGAYGPETGSGGPDFEQLIEELAAECAIPRIRVSSIEMRQVTPRLIQLIKDGVVVPHLHIPLQSGDDDVLKDMNRPYRRQDYLDLCDTLYREVPDISLTTDILVGFPTETDVRFAQTEDLCRKARFLKVHAFRFSPRFGTPADSGGDPVPVSEKQRRSASLAAISKETGDRHAQRFVGRPLRVLVESKHGKDGLLEGLSDNYLTVKFAGPESCRRQLVWVYAHELRDGTLYGELCEAPTLASCSLPLSG